MAKHLLTCPRCRQLNDRYTGGFSSLLLTPRYPNECSLCRTDLRTGERPVYRLFYAYLTWVVIYGTHILLGMFFLTIPIALLVWAIVGVEAIFAPVALASIAGAILGLWNAETARRRGELLTKKAKKNRKQT